MRLLVCGDRNWKDYSAILAKINEMAPEVVIEGEARGADLMARRAAEKLGIPVLKFSAEWDAYGRAAGFIRNQQMLIEGKPDYVLAFHDDIENSRGTKDMVQRAEKAGIQVEVWSHLNLNEEEE